MFAKISVTVDSEMLKSFARLLACRENLIFINITFLIIAVFLHMIKNSYYKKIRPDGLLFNQIPEMEVLFGLFEFEALAFFGVHPFLKLVKRGIHGMISFFDSEPPYYSKPICAIRSG